MRGVARAQSLVEGVRLTTLWRQWVVRFRAEEEFRPGVWWVRLLEFGEDAPQSPRSEEISD